MVFRSLKLLAKFTANAPLVFVDQYIGNLKQYRAIAMDVGDQDGLRVDAGKLHDMFDKYGIANTFRDLFRYAYQRRSRSLPEPCDAVLQQESLLYRGLPLARGRGSRLRIRAGSHRR
jgi:hypothetical protein